ncbi:YlqD family protein [Microaerobacter geothermalis]|nr:YlqD family protein [Microaerobacter geothermalis]
MSKPMEKQMNVMKKRKWIIGSLFGASILSVALLTGNVWAGTNNAIPGSVDDPIVSKSYVDEQIALMKAQLKQELTTELNEQFKDSLSKGAGDLALSVVELKPGQTLIGFEGTEIIVRTGKVIAKQGDNGDGLPNLTAGSNIEGGQFVPLNHLILLPRNDNRGIIVVPDAKQNSWVMIRGKYEVK